MKIEKLAYLIERSTKRISTAVAHINDHDELSRWTWRQFLKKESRLHLKRSIEFWWKLLWWR